MTIRTGAVRVAAIYIDCPNRVVGCGGGVEGTDGSFMLYHDNLPEGFRAGALVECSECTKSFWIPAAAARFLGVQ